MQEQSPDKLNFTINFGPQHPAAHGVQACSWVGRRSRGARGSDSAWRKASRSAGTAMKRSPLAMF